MEREELGGGRRKIREVGKRRGEGREGVYFRVVWLPMFSVFPAFLFYVLSLFVRFFEQKIFQFIFFCSTSFPFSPPAAEVSVCICV